MRPLLVALALAAGPAALLPAAAQDSDVQPDVVFSPGLIPGISGPSLDLGASMAPIEDLNGDGVPDLLVTAPGFCPDPTCGIGVGRIYAFSGADGSVIYTVDPVPIPTTPEDPPLRNLFAGDLGVGPDLDGDGVPDFASLSDIVYFFSGADGTELPAYVPDDGARFSGSLLWVPDLDGDGQEDFVISRASAVNASGIRTGGIRLVSSATFETLGEATPDGATEGARFGEEMVRIGDTDGDGAEELVISAYDDDSASLVDAGRVYKVELVPGLTEAPVLLAEGREASGLFGIWLAALDDVDGDGVRDVIATGAASGMRAPFVVSSASGEVLYQVQDPIVVPGLEFGLGGQPISTGDLDGDGTDDFHVGDPLAIDLQTFEFTGHLFTYSGADGTLLRTITNPDAAPDTLHNFGIYVASIDLNGDGLEDAVVASDYNQGVLYGYYSMGTGTTAAEPDAAPQLALAAYPNPARERLHVRTEAGAPAEVLVVDALGREVRRAEVVGAATFDVSGWAPGLYLVRVTTADGFATRTVTIAR